MAANQIIFGCWLANRMCVHFKCFFDAKICPLTPTFVLNFIESLCNLTLRLRVLLCVCVSKQHIAIKKIINSIKEIDVWTNCLMYGIIQKKCAWFGLFKSVPAQIFLLNNRFLLEKSIESLLGSMKNASLNYLKFQQTVKNAWNSLHTLWNLSSVNLFLIPFCIYP